MTRLRRTLGRRASSRLPGRRLAWATPAAAHAAVTASSPAQGQHLAKVPHAVTINFDQPVQPDDGGLVVLNSSGQRYRWLGAPGPGHTCRPRCRRRSAPGAYVSDYTVTSVDGHVVSGGIVFLVGHVKAGAITALARPQDVADELGRRLRPVPRLPRRPGGVRAGLLPGLHPAGRERAAPAAAVDLRGHRARPRGHGRDRWRAVGPDRRRPVSVDALEHRHGVLRRQVRRAVRRTTGGAGGLLGLAATSQDDQPPVRRLLRPARGRRRLRPLRSCPRLARALAQYSGRHRARGLRRHVGRRTGRARDGAAHAGPGRRAWPASSPATAPASRRWVRRHHSSARA